MNNKLLLELVARHISSPGDWDNFSKAGSEFKYVCNKLLNDDAVDYKSVCHHTYRYKGFCSGTMWHYILKNGVKHGPETVDRLYYSYYRNGKMHGREWEKKQYHPPPKNEYNGDYLEYECDWRFGERHGWCIEYWGKGWGYRMESWVRNKKHGVTVLYTNDDNLANQPIGFEVWVKDKRVLEYYF